MSDYLKCQSKANHKKRNVSVVRLFKFQQEMLLDANAFLINTQIFVVFQCETEKNDIESGKEL